MRHFSRGTSFVVTSLLLGLSSGCLQSESDEPSAPDQPVSVEGGLRIAEEAAASIGIETAAVQSQLVPSTITTTGWLVIKPGYEATVRAVATGFVTLEDESDGISLGDAVSVEQRLGTIRVFVSPQEEAQLVVLKEQADILIRQSMATLEATEVRFKRLEELGEVGAVPGKEKQLVKEAMERAKAAYEEAQHQLPFLPSEPYERPLQLNASVITSSIAGRLTKMHVLPRQLVIQGDPLWTISDWSLLWLRVPVFEGDLPRIDQTEPAEVRKPGMELSMRATPTGIPQPTEAGRRTVDLFYEVANADGALRPGQAISVELPTGKTGRPVVVPKSAVLWDGMGNAWVYLEEETNLFRRQRIRIGQSLDEVVVVEHGLSDGQSVVTVGAEALYGEEFKGQIQVLEDDD